MAGARESETSPAPACHEKEEINRCDQANSVKSKSCGRSGKSRMERPPCRFAVNWASRRPRFTVELLRICDGVALSELREVRELRDENQKLKRIVANLLLERHGSSKHVT